MMLLKMHGAMLCIECSVWVKTTMLNINYYLLHNIYYFEYTFRKYYILYCITTQKYRTFEPFILLTSNSLSCTIKVHTTTDSLTD